MKHFYRLPATALIVSVMNQIRELERSGEIWRVVFMAVFLGMRRKEIICARWSWFHPGSNPRVSIIRESDFTPKRGHERDIEVQPWVFDVIRSLHLPGRVHVLPGTKSERYRLVDKVTVAFLRKIGVSAQTPVHELRKWFGSWTTARRGLTFAQRQLGHTSYKVTEEHYGDIRFPDELDAFWTKSEVAAKVTPPHESALKPANGGNSSVLEGNP